MRLLWRYVHYFLRFPNWCSLTDCTLQLLNAKSVLKQNNTTSNIKLLAMALACAAALSAQFYPLPFEKSRYFVGAGITLYFFFSACTQYITSFVEKDKVFESRPTSQGEVYVVRTIFPRGTDIYTVKVEKNNQEIAQYETSVGRYFNTKGELCKDPIFNDLKSKLLTPFNLSVSKED